MEDYKIKQLKKLNDKQILEDIKKFIKSSNAFYESKVPELKTLGKRLHEEHNLKEFYRVFNRLWNSNKSNEMTLAFYTLQLYKEDFDLNTWKFIKPKLKDMKSWDQIDSIGAGILGYILLRNPIFENEIITLSKAKNIWLLRMALMSTIPLIKSGNNSLAIKLLEENINLKNEHLQKALGVVLMEIGDKDPESAKRFILRNMNMPNLTFLYATEHMKELRRVRGIKKLGSSNFGRLMFWKE